MSEMVELSEKLGVMLFFSVLANLGLMAALGYCNGRLNQLARERANAAAKELKDCP